MLFIICCIYIKLTFKTISEIEITFYINLYGEISTKPKGYHMV